jgi:hypothetical protein
MRQFAGTDSAPNATSGRMILWCSYAFGMVIYTAYSAALISKLTVREVDYPFESLDQMLLAPGFRPLLLRDSSLHHLSKVQLLRILFCGGATFFLIKCSL